MQTASWEASNGTVTNQRSFPRSMAMRHPIFLRLVKLTVIFWLFGVFNHILFITYSYSSLEHSKHGNLSFLNKSICVRSNFMIHSSTGQEGAEIKTSQSKHNTPSHSWIPINSCTTVTSLQTGFYIAPKYERGDNVKYDKPRRTLVSLFRSWSRHLAPLSKCCAFISTLSQSCGTHLKTYSSSKLWTCQLYCKMLLKGWSVKLFLIFAPAPPSPDPVCSFSPLPRPSDSGFLLSPSDKRSPWRVMIWPGP